MLIREFYYIDETLSVIKRNFIKAEMEKSGGKIKGINTAKGTMSKVSN